MPMSEAANISASADELIHNTVRAARTPIAWLNLPLAPMLTKSRGATLRPVI